MKLDIVGGTYRESCEEGEWHQLFGSGLRAAAALQRLQPTRLHTFIGKKDIELLEVIGNTFDIEINANQVEQTIRFEYDHGLAVPQIFPPVHTIQAVQTLELRGDNVLRFGMVEGDALVQGRMVVYDPQSAYSPKRYSENGSTAERLVIVCNRREAFLLTGESEIAKAASRLIDLENAEAVVVKCGSYGALAIDDNGCHRIPAFRTNRIWPIGSGDVFASTFFAFWTQGQVIAEAAMGASKAAASYCESATLPLSKDVAQCSDYPELSLRDFSPEDAKPIIYLAGPFFNMGQRWLVNQARAALYDQNLNVFSPFHDVGFGSADEVVAKDIEGIKKAALVFALLDHFDSGTVFEVGYARSLGIPVIGFCQNTSDEDLKMLVGTECKVFNDFSTAIYHAAWTALQQ